MEVFISVFILSYEMIVFYIFNGHGGENFAKHGNESIQKVLEGKFCSEIFLWEFLKKLYELMVQKFKKWSEKIAHLCLQYKRNWVFSYSKIYLHFRISKKAEFFYKLFYLYFKINFNKRECVFLMQIPPWISKKKICNNLF